MRAGLAAFAVAAALLLVLQALSGTASAQSMTTHAALAAAKNAVMQPTSPPFTNPSCYSTNSIGVTVTCNERLTGPLTYSDILIQSGATLDTNGFAIDALSTFIVQSHANVINTTAGGGGSSTYGLGGETSSGEVPCCVTGLLPASAKRNLRQLAFSPVHYTTLLFDGSTCYSINGNGQSGATATGGPSNGYGCNGEEDSIFTSKVAGGIGGSGSNGNACSASFAGTGGDGPNQEGYLNLGGAGANAGGGSAGSANPGGLTSPCQSSSSGSGGDGGGYISIQSEQFYNYGTINASGFPGTSDSAYPGGGGGGGYVHITVTSQDTGQIHLGTIMANGGNTTLTSNSGDRACAGSGGGGVINITMEYSMSSSQLKTSGLSVHGGSVTSLAESPGYNCPTNGGTVIYSNSNTANVLGRPGQIVFTHLPEAKTPLECLPPYGPYTETQGHCFFTSNTAVSTSYPNTGYGGSLVPSTGAQHTTPVTSSVLGYNDNNAQWLITCPSAPDSSNTLLYYNQKPGTYTGGDLCLAKSSQLNTLIQVNTTVEWSQNNPANATVQIYIANAVAAQLQDLGLSGEANATSNYLQASGYVYQPFSPTTPQGNCYLAIIVGKFNPTNTATACGWSPAGSGTLHFQGNSYGAEYYTNVSNTFLFWVVWTGINGIESVGTVPIYSPAGGGLLTVPVVQSNAISNGYNTQSYIFGQVPASPQQGVWSWSLEYADIGNADAAKLSQAQQVFPEAGATFSSLELKTNSCTYYYSFTYSLNFQSINNANIPIPTNQKGTPSSRLVFNGYVYSPVYDISSQLSNSGYSLYGDCWPIGGCPPVLGYGNLYLNGQEQGSFSNSGSYVYDSSTVKGSNGKNLPPGNYIVATQQTCYTGYIFPYQCSSTWAIPKSAMTTKNVQFLPYFLYNLSMPATLSDVNGRIQYLNLSFDMYSPHNYMDPGNFLDPFPLSTGSGFFANVKGNIEEFSANSLSSASSSAFSAGTTEFTVVPPSSKQVSTNYNLNLGNLINQVIPDSQSTISNPVFIAAAPNDYIYVLTESTSCTSSFLVCTSSTTTTTIYKFRYIPQGYYNMTNAAPNFAEGQYTGSYSDWKNAWDTYWKYDLKAQASNLYLTNVTQLTSDTSTWCFYTTCVSGGSNLKALQNIVPTALTSDYADDVFMVGNVRGSSGKFVLAAIPSVGNIIANTISSSTAYNFMPTDLIASDAGGQFIYLANPNYGAIPYFAANTLSYGGNFTLSYNTSTTGTALDITAYLAHGGPFGNATVANYYTNNPALNSNSLPNLNDTSQFHHPIALFSSGGLLYVIDNWTISEPPTLSCFQHHALSGVCIPTPLASILMLRAFLYNGTEVPLHPSQQFDMALSQGMADLSQGSNGIAQAYPPYGWPLAANISVGNGNYVSYCIAGCSSTPLHVGANNMSGYETIGPMVNVSGNVGSPAGGSIAFAPAFNGSIYMLAHDQPCTLYLYTGLSAGGSCRTSTNPNPYTVLLSFKPDILNYTTLSNGANAQYTCDINTNAVVSPCSYNNNIGSLNAPFAEVPSSFSYVTSEGAPQQYFSAASVYQSLYPSGSSGSSSSGSAAANTVTGNTPNNALSINSLSTNPLSTGAPSMLVQSPTYINSIIGGYIVLPYHAQFTLNRNWNVYPDSTCSASSFYSRVGADSSGSNTLAVDGYSVYAAPVSGSSVNLTIEGGPTYLQAPASGKFYDANVSDANLIMPPEMYYKIFSNRVFGNVYINQSVAPSDTQELSRELFINATHNYNYSVVTFYQSYDGVTAPGYSMEESVPLSFAYPHTGPAAVPTSSSLTYYLGNSALSYSNFTSTQFVSLFHIYSMSSQLDGLLLDLRGNNNILGYNRFLYTFVDRFDNIIYMPLDVNLANLTSIALNVNQLINATNDNETLIIANGTAGYTTGVLGGSFAPLPPGSDIYLYYDTNINFYNSTGADPNSASYAAWQDLCAFDPAMRCQLADPLESTTTQSSGLTSTGYVGHIDFHTQYNGTTGSSGKNLCSPQPKGLLSVAESNNCNIYGNVQGLGGPAKYNQATGTYNYCVPSYNNGTGSYTTQIGLIAVEQTGQGGYFQDNSITACGMGSAILTAKYYGAPSPQPVIYSQRSMPQAASGPAQICVGYSFNPNTFKLTCTKYELLPTAPTYNFPEFSYTYSPNQTSVSFQTGNFSLSFGSTGALALMAGIAAALAIVLARLGIARRQPS